MHTGSFSIRPASHHPPMRTAKPLTVAEKKHLDTWDCTLERSARRGYLIATVGGFLAGGGLAWWLLSGGGTSTLSNDLSFLRPVEAAIGPNATMVLFSGVLFALGMTTVMWRVQRAQRAMQAQYRARYIAAGADGEPLPAEAP